jgi:DNA-binding protein HU-beta
MTKTELIDRVATDTGLSKKDAASAVNAVFDGITTVLKEGGTVTITGFGTFEVRQRKERSGVKPGTTERITIEASKAPAFRAGSTLKASVR